MALLRSVLLWGFVIVCQNVNSAVAVGGAHFCYKDQDCSPNTWHGVCQTGKRQSPINIPANSTNFAAGPKTELHLETCYSRSKTFTMENNGHTAEADFRRDQTSNCTIYGGLLGASYTFAQLHFHWGSTEKDGSEHSVNGKSYVMEGHLVHYRSNFDNVSEAAASKEPNALTVLAIFFELSEADNPALDPIIRALKSVRSADTEVASSRLLLARILGIKARHHNADVIQYDGSLTTPGCDEIVLWNVFTQPQPISRAQLEAFRDIDDDSHRPLVDNERPLQALNGREIRYYPTAIEAHGGTYHAKLASRVVTRKVK